MISEQLLNISRLYCPQLMRTDINQNPNNTRSYGMSLKQKIFATVAGGLAIAACVAAVSLGAPALVQAQTNPPATANPPATGAARVNGQDQYLANALGITTDQLQTARTNARNATIDQAFKDGKITQSQADALKSGRRGFGFGFGVTGNGQQALATALNITVEKLQAAEQTAYEAQLAQSVTDGRITQAQADLRLGEQKLHKYIVDKKVFENTVNEALAAGVLTDAQAKALTAQANQAAPDGMGFFGKGGGFGGPGGFGDFGGHGGFGGRGGLGGRSNSGTQQPNAVPSAQAGM
jgi:hypothetical protein